MRATMTPMLLLGATGLFGPINGYQIRRELNSWRADKWSNLNPGSVYHGLNALSDKGFLTRYDLFDRGREVAVYDITDAGHVELTRLIETAIMQIDTLDGRNFFIAFGLLPLLDRDHALRLLRRRRTEFSMQMDSFSVDPDYPYAPPHARRGAALGMALVSTELEWLTAVIADVEAGTLSLDPRGSWTPPPDDIAYEFATDRERYRQLIASQS